MNMKMSNYVRVALTQDQKDMVDLIEKEFVDAGLSRYWAAGAVVNAMKESKLDPYEFFYGKDYAKTKKKTEDSVGLFMLNSMGGGLGTGMPKGFEYPKGDSRFDPTLNTRRVIRAIKNLKAAREAFDDAGIDIPEVAAHFTKWIENPKNLYTEQEDRREIARQMFPVGIEGFVSSSTALTSQKSLPLSQPEKGSSSSSEDEMSGTKKAILVSIALLLGGIAYTSKLRYDKLGKKPWQL